ncbi:unnamed protein product [Lactuca virosa]|uniref:Uncharacterized protein n=1 Tax=Lactuca virosa TaxID=75947 RepID=A0AAU9MUW6_9ASTR|nr:unnamed protein product [Lactuca virosa]
MARSMAIVVFNMVLLVVLVLSVEMMTPTMSRKACSELIPMQPNWCDGPRVSVDCWDACGERHNPYIAAECFHEGLLPGNINVCKCYWEC